MDKLKYFVPSFVFIALAILLWRGLYLDTRTLPSMLIDKPLPTFTLAKVGGEPVSNSDLPDEIFLLNVWGSYCLPCLIEHPTFMRLSEEGEIPVVGINYKDRNELAKDWLDTNGNPFSFSIEDLDGRFGIDLGANLDPFWPDFSVLGISWGALGASWGRLWEARCRLGAFARGLNFLNDFGIDFLIILASFWEPSSAWLGLRWGPKSAKNLTRGSPRGSLNRPCIQIRFWRLLQ